MIFFAVFSIERFNRINHTFISSVFIFFSLSRPFPYQFGSVKRQARFYVSYRNGRLRFDSNRLRFPNA